MQEWLPQFEAHSATLVAISPEYPDNSLSLVEKHGLKFSVLTDADMTVSRSFGIVYELAPALDTLFQNFGIDLRGHHHSDRAELPLSATYVVDTSGAITYAYVEADYTYRAEPAEIVKALEKL